MQYLYRLFTLSWADHWLLVEAGLWLGLAQAAVLTQPFCDIMHMLGQSPNAPLPPNDSGALPQIQRVAWAIDVMSRCTPWHSNSLAQAVAGLVLLHRHRIACTLYLGMIKPGANQIEVHAWLHSNDVIVTGGHQPEMYAVTARFASISTLTP